MIKRMLAVSAVAMGLAVLPSTGASAVVQQANRTWFCVGVGHLNMGVCQGNPIPDIPETPEIPRLPL